MKQAMNRKTIKYAFKRSLPVMAGYLVLGMGFGILLKTKGYGVIWAFVMSLFIYAGSMQYVTINLLAGGATILSAAMMTLMVNARHLFYGISMIERYRNTEPYKQYLIFGLTDETYSLVCSGTVPEGVDEKKYFFLLTLLNQSYWIIGSVVGSLLGSLITFNTAGIEFSMTALFLVVFVDQWKSVKNHTGAVVGVGVSVVCLLVFGAENFLIPTMIAITVILTVLRKKLSIREEKEEKGKNKKTPDYITYISSVLPYAIMGMLVVYCLKAVNITAAPHGIPELIAGAVVVGLHLWKKNTLLSIVVGTVVYMLLIQCVF